MTPAEVPESGDVVDALGSASPEGSLSTNGLPPDEPVSPQGSTFASPNEPDLSPENLRARVSAWLKPGGLGSETGIPGDGVGTNGDGGRGPRELRELPVGSIETNPYQPRRVFDSEALDDLAASIGELGVLQPVLVRPVDDGGYALIAGERRWRAARRAGLKTIPAIVRDTDDLASLEEAIVENLHRSDLNPLEEAAAFQQLMSEFGLTQDETARRVGKSRSAVANTLRLLSLRPAVQALVAQGALSAGHARPLLTISDSNAQQALAQRIVDEELSVRATEKLAKAANSAAVGSKSAESGGSKASEQGRPAWALEIQERLSDRLDTRVEVQDRAGTGKIVIQFADEDDLERIYRLLR